jgi:hypothetical protein
VPRIPPRKRAGISSGRRSLAGEMMDFKAVSEAFGGSEQFWRSRAARGAVPYHRLGGRIFFLRSELQEFLRALPGVSLREARENQAAARGD